jgi:hypothetical protein
MYRRDLRKIETLPLLQVKHEYILSCIKKDLTHAKEHPAKDTLAMQLNGCQMTKTHWARKSWTIKKKVKDSKVWLKKLTKKGAELKKQRGKSSHSLAQAMEAMMARCGSKREL